MRDKAIHVEHLSKRFGGVAVLDGVHLSVARGTLLALLGPNGAGKTTMVRILATLLRPDDGEVRVLGFDVVRESARVREHIGLTGQYAAVDELLSGRENLELIAQLHHLPRKRSKARAAELLDYFDLTSASDRAVKTYSGGMKRRLDLAASLVAHPQVLFLDEPTTGLDPRSRLGLWDMVQHLKKEGVTILLTTQYLEEADRLADGIAVLDHGRIIAEGTAADLKAQAGSERIELVFQDGATALKAAKVFSSLPAQCQTQAAAVSVVTDDSVRMLRRILERLEAAQIELASLSVHKPTLDDVFLKITGKEIPRKTS